MANNESTRTRRPAERASFVHDTAGGILTVRIRGEIDHHTAVSIRQGVDHLLYEHQPRKLILDLSEVSFMDSSGLGLIMGRLALLRQIGGEMVVRNPSRETRSILRLAGMEKLVRIEYTAPAEGEGTTPDRPSARTSKGRRSSAGRPHSASAERSRRRTGERPNPTEKERQP